MDVFCLPVKLAFTSDRVQEINATKGACDNRIYGAPRTVEAHMRVPADVREDVSLTHLDECQFRVVAVC